MRKSGILLPITSIPSKYGIGTMGEKAYEFIDFLVAAGQSMWQILPVGPTGYGDSPYQSFSTFAGNPYFIDLEMLMKEGLLDITDCENLSFGDDETLINYEIMYKNRFQVLKKAYEKFIQAPCKKYKKFKQENKFWLEDYALYMAIKDSLGGISYFLWDEDLRFRKKHSLDEKREQLKEEIEFYQFQQYKFYEQWEKLKQYANENKIEIVGDIPIYVAMDSADTWANRKLFQIDHNGEAKAVAGCPPDAFSKTGQLWGNPLYDWEYHKKKGYEWWIKRISFCTKLYDVIRIDHFRGFDEYYSIPSKDETAEFGHWEQGPGYELFETIKKELGKVNIIAEDLGFLTKSVLRLVKKCGYPGMKILQFAFDAREDSDYLPYNYDKNSVVYTGTHDNDTTVGWYDTISKEDKKFANRYLEISNKKEVAYSMIKLALASVSDTAIIPMQDYLELDSSARINVPSTMGENWKWRLTEEECSKELAAKILDLTKLYGRTRKLKK